MNKTSLSLSLTPYKSCNKTTTETLKTKQKRVDGGGEENYQKITG
jgi:hypothetical protein